MTRVRPLPGSAIWAAVLGVLVMSGCSAPPAASEPSRSQDGGPVLTPDQVAGYWMLEGPDGARCEVSLANLVIDGVRPVLVENCEVAQVSEGKTWRATAGGFQILDASGAVLMAFRRTGEDAFDATTGGFTLRRSPLF